MFAVLRFWLVIQFLTLAALPLTRRWLRALPSRGYVLAKPLGLLLVSYVFWLGSSLGLLRNSVGGVLLSWAVVAVIGLWLGRGFLPWLSPYKEERVDWRLVGVTEGLFLLALAGWALIRSYSPEITTAGGEKFMELTFLNGILRSQRFPPLDPWLAGFAISYYYFGYVMLAALTRLSGLAPSVAFNVGLAAWFALTVTAAFGVAFDLVAALQGRKPEQPTGKASVSSTKQTEEQGAESVTGSPAALVGGLLGALFVAVLSNLEGFLESLQNLGFGSLAFWRWLDIKDLNCLGGPTFTQPLVNCPSPTGSLLPQRFFWWWRASRVIDDRDLLGNAVEVIDEFPFFSFLLGDMHPHVLALPFVLLAIGLALALMLGMKEVAGSGQRGNGWIAGIMDLFPLGTGGLVLYALCLGGLAFLNTWDFPIYVLLVTLVLGVRLTWQAGGLNARTVAQTLAGGLALGVLGVAFYLPFYVGFQSQAGGILPNFVFPTRLTHFFVMFGPLLVAATFLLLALSLQRGQTLRRWLGWLPWTLLVPLVFLLVVLAVGVVTPAGREMVRRVMEIPAVQAQVGNASLGQIAVEVLKLRLATPWVYLLLAALIAWTLALLPVPPSQPTNQPTNQLTNQPTNQLTNQPTNQPAPDLPVTTFALLALLVAFLLTFSVEFVYLRDTFGTRMNTVFKFYYQAWVLMALVAAFSLVYLSRQAGLVLKAAGMIATGLLVITGLFYPVFATYTRAEGFNRQPTLDGTAYLERQNPADAAAIAWLRANVPGIATILEASGGSYSYAGRISAQTGLPTLLGWDGHELQWRGDTVEQDKRRPDIERIYRGAPVAELRQLLEKWQIDYMIVGELERRTYGVSPQAEARLAQVMDLVYDSDGVRIYRRR